MIKTVEWGRYIETILKSWSVSVTAISDAQEPYLHIFSSAAKLIGKESVGNDFVDQMFFSLLEIDGRVTPANADPEQVLSYLMARAGNSWNSSQEFVAKPSLLLAALMLVGMKTNKDQTWDVELSRLDHNSFSYFLPTDIRSMALEYIPEGTNNTFVIGEGLWTLEDFRVKFNSECLSAIVRPNGTDELTIEALSILSSLMYPDRLALFLDS